MTVSLREWTNADAPLLAAGNTAEMTRYLGGSESEAQVAERHERYLQLTASGEARVFVITDDDVPVGAINRWSTTWRDSEVYETGWFVLPEAQGRGIARAAVDLVVTDAAEHGDRDLLTAFPAVDNAASNGLCRSAGFRLEGTEDIVFRGADLHVNAWTLDLAVLRRTDHARK